MIQPSQAYQECSARLRAREPEAVAQLQALARAGDPYAQMALGDMQVAGKGIKRDQKRGLLSIRKAARQGMVEAARTEIYLTAKGIGCKPNPDKARAMLAELGKTDRFAAVQSQLLQHSTARSKLQAMQPEVISGDPRMVIWRGLFSQAEYGYLRHIGEPLMRPSMIVNPATGKGMVDPIRKSYSHSIMQIDEDLMVQEIVAVIAAATGTSTTQAEPMTILRYRVEDEYKRHYDAYDKNWKGPQRVKTALLWLNDEFDGGETYFNRLDIKVRGNPGDLLVFDNLDANGERDMRMEHAGLPVKNGEKWLANRWIVDRDTQSLAKFG